MTDQTTMITEKEAAERYPYSVAWFQRQRWAGGGPRFLKLSTHKIVYRIEDLEEYFDQFKTHQSTSEYTKKEEKDGK